MTSSDRSGDSYTERYLKLIDQIVDTTLQGKIRSKVQVYQLVQGIEAGTGEIFERCLEQRINATQAQLDTKIKATRILRALQTIQGEWERWQRENEQDAAIAAAIDKILSEPERLCALTQTLDSQALKVPPFGFASCSSTGTAKTALDSPEEVPAAALSQLNQTRLEQLATALKQAAQSRSEPELAQFAQGITDGLASWKRLEGELITWMYEKDSLGFGQTEQKGPWALWAKKVESPLLKQLFQTLAAKQSFVEAGLKFEPAAWVEMTIVLQYLQRGLVQFFDQRVYSTKLGAKLSIATFITFAMIWSELANGLRGDRVYANSCLQITLQILRTFARREYFPLYGGVFASFSGESLGEVFRLDKSLQQAAATQEKARILTLLGYSAQAQSEFTKATTFHQQALEIAREASDLLCEVANLNHLSRLHLSQKDYEQALSYSQRALVLSRQSGDRVGQANALANLGYSEVLHSQQLEREPEVYETAIGYLQQGLELSEKLGDRQSHALCGSSLGIAYVLLNQPQAAIGAIAKGLKAAQESGDLYLQGLNYAYLAEAYYKMAQLEKTVVSSCLGAYLLEQIGAREWRQPAGLLVILQGQQPEAFERILKQSRSEIISVIGFDGYDYLPEMLEHWHSH